MKKIFTLLVLLMTIIIGAKANQTELISGITLPDVPTGTLDLANQTDYTADANGWIVATSLKGVIDSKTWHSKLTTDGGEDTWTVPSGTTAPFVSSTSDNIFKKYTVRSNARTHAIRFTGAEAASFLVHRSSDAQKTFVSIFSYVGTTQTLIETKSLSSGSIGELLFNELSTSTTYIAYIYGNSTSNSNWYEFALKAPVDPSNLTITDEGFYVGSVSVTMSAASGFDIYYTTNGTTPTNESTPYTGAINVTATTTIKAIAYNSSTTTYGAVKTATYTIVGDYVKYDFTAPTAADLAALRANTSAWTDDTDKKYIKNAADWSSNTDYALEGSDGTDISVANGLLFGRSGGAVSAGSARYYYEEGGVETYYFYLNNGSCYIKVPNVAAGQQVVITMSAGGGRTISADNATPASYSYSSSDGIKSYAFTATKSGTISISNSGGGYKIYSIEVRSVKSVSISQYEWATFVSDKALDFTDSDVKAYVVTGYSGSAIVKSNEVKKIPANTPLLLNAPEGTYVIPVTATPGTIATNYMKAGTGSAISYEAGKTKYVLGVEGENAQFQKIVSTPATVPVGKAYLEFKEVIESRSLGFDDEVTAIKNIKVGTEDNIYYDLNGRRVLYPKKGLYIVNGKKVIVK